MVWSRHFKLNRLLQQSITSNLNSVSHSIRCKVIREGDWICSHTEEVKWSCAIEAYREVKWRHQLSWNLNYSTLKTLTQHTFEALSPIPLWCVTCNREERMSRRPICSTFEESTSIRRHWREVEAQKEHVTWNGREGSGDIALHMKEVRQWPEG